MPSFLCIQSLRCVVSSAEGSCCLVWVSNQEHASLSLMVDFFLILDHFTGLSLLFKIYSDFMCMDVSPACMSVHMHICGWGLYI